jgi:hypothetical protein
MGLIAALAVENINALHDKKDRRHFERGFFIGWLIMWAVLK